MSDLSPNSEPSLWMITATPTTEASEGEKSGDSFQGGVLGGGTPAKETKATGKVSMTVSKLQENLNQFFEVVGDLFARAEQQAQTAATEGETEAKSGMQLEQIEFSVAVNGEGEVGFWGLAGTKVGGATEIKLTFTRKES
ncbi:MAG: hypothetical protein AAGA60_05470 [Cyanobacteria bacterium P01_E01_bin.42]